MLFFFSDSVSILQYLIQLRLAWNVVARFSKDQEIKEENKNITRIMSNRYFSFSEVVHGRPILLRSS